MGSALEPREDSFITPDYEIKFLNPRHIFRKKDQGTILVVYSLLSESSEGNCSTYFFFFFFGSEKLFLNTRDR